MDTSLNGHYRNIHKMLDQSLTGTKIEFSIKWVVQYKLYVQLDINS
jgi:hypothetical protein